MSAVPQTDEASEEAAQLAYDKIPVRNVWFLFLYAYDLARFQGRFEAEVEDSPDFKSLIARLLCHVVEMRLRRNLSFGYRRREDTLKRVRGRIDILETVSRDLFRRGEIACRFEELTIDTPRNRLLRVALSALVYCLKYNVVNMRRNFCCRQGVMTSSGGHHARKSNAADGEKDQHIHHVLFETVH